MKTLLPLLALMALYLNCHAQNFDDVTIKTIKLTDNTYMLEGAGGNIGVLVGNDGVLVIDDQFAPLTPKIETAIKALSKQPITYLVNTHFHGDHTGGNANMHALGATIIGHKNVRERLNKPNKKGVISPKEALPTLTFNDKMQIHTNEETIMAFHVDNAHTDGDTLLYLVNNNVLHTGDTYFKNWYPYIDLNAGGSVNGYIKAVKLGLSFCDDNTKIIPGHGQLATTKEYKAYLKMLEGLKENVLTEIAKGKTEEEVVKNKTITQMFDDLGYSWNFITSEKIKRTFYKSLKGTD